MIDLRILSPTDQDEVQRLMAEFDVHPSGIKIMAPKTQLRLVKITGLDPKGANVLKQEMLSKGGDAALSWKAYELASEERADVLAVATLKQFRELIPKLEQQPFRLKEVALKLGKALEAYDSRPPALEIAGRTLDFSARTYIMGVLNVTPDSFSDGGEYVDEEAAVEHARMLVAEGADIIDIGGESTRPGAEAVSSTEEIARVIPIIQAIAGSTETIISIDTMKAEVAAAAIEAGAHMVNDITALGGAAMRELVAGSGVPAVLMHMKGTPRTMQLKPEYDDLMGEIIAFLRDRLETAEEAGISPEKLLVDPGIGFGKTIEHNLEIIKNLHELKVLGRGIVLGSSRKSFIGKILGVEEPAERLLGTAATVVIGVVNGAHVMRVHDVKEMKQVAAVADAVKAGQAL